MSWGVATQNGVSVSLASIVSLSCGATEFSPASLFTGGVAGAWYDPSDYSTLFQDSAGTTPVTAVEQPVRLMLDKSQGLVLGSELVTGAASAYTGNGTVSTVGDTVTATCTTNGTYGIRWTSSNISNIWTRCTFEVVTNSASKSLNFYPNLAHAGISVGTTTGSKTYTVFAPTASGGNQVPVFFISGLVGESFSVRLVSIKELPGNHALAPNDLSRPVLRARYNLLTYSEQFDNAAWLVTGVTRSADVTTAPDGTATADRITGSSGTNAVLFPLTGYTALAGNITISCYIKAGTADYAVLSLWSGSSTNGVNLWVNVQTGAIGSNSATAGYTFVSGSSTAVGNGWYRVVLTGTVPAGACYFSLRLVDGDNAFSYTNTVGKTLFVWGADLRTGSSAGTYQRIAAATDYATAGFDPYLAADGVDDFLAAAYVQSAYPLTLAAGINNDSISVTFGAFVSVAQSDTVYKVARDNAVGATDAQDRNTSTLSTGGIIQAGNKFVLTQFETSLLTQQVNSGTANTTANTNAFGTSANIFLGKARPTNLFSAAKVYGVVITNSVLSASQISSLRSWMGQKMGVTL